MSSIVIGIIGIVALIVLIFLGMNIGTSMFFVGFVGYALVTNVNAAAGILGTVPVVQAMKYSFIVIPLFTLMGNACFAAGMSGGLYDAARKWLGRIPGSLTHATIVASAVFGAICGSSTATVSTMANVAMPEMRKYGYSDKLSTGCIAAAGGLGILIPPSGGMIVYGISTGESIQKLFFSGVFPGILMAVAMMAVVWIKLRIDPTLAPRGEHFSWKEKFISLKGIVGVVAIFIIVLGGMGIGVFTVNEAAGIGAFLSLGAMLVRGRFTRENVTFVFKNTAKHTAMIFWLIIGATVFGNFLAISQLPTSLASYIQGLAVSRYLILAIILLIYAFLGMIMDSAPMLLLTLPIFYPIITILGFDGIWFGVAVILMTNFGFITPPVGLNCYVMKGVARDVPLTTIFKSAIPYLYAIGACVVLVTIFPQIALWLPGKLA